MLRTITRAVQFQNISLKNFHSSALLRLREIIVEKKNEKTTVIDCKYITSPREPYLIKTNQNKDKCPLCKLGLNLKHTDVLILCQYIDSQGKLLKFSETNLCEQQYKLVKELVYMAQYAGLLPEPPRDEPKKPYNLLNTYYDESTIKLKYKPYVRDHRLHHLQKNLSPIQKLRIKPEKPVMSITRKERYRCVT